MATLIIGNPHSHSCHHHSCGGCGGHSIELNVAGLINVNQTSDKQNDTNSNNPNMNPSNNNQSEHPQFLIKNTSGEVIYEQ